MNKYFIFSFLIVATTFFACETDFELEGEWRDIPVIYAFLSTLDDNHYVRVERAFLEPGGDATKVAQIPDSIYYAENEAVVRLELEGGAESYTLERVNGEDEGFEREEGDFANSPNILYKLPASAANIGEDELFSIVIERGVGTEPAVASSVMLAPIDIIDTPVTGAYEFGDYQGSQRFSWRTDGDFVQVYDFRVKFFYEESLPNNPTEFQEKSVEWVIESALPREGTNSRVDYRVRNETFFIFVSENIEPNPQITRRVGRVVIQVTGVGQEVADYLRISNANIGITSSQEIPIYTNVENGLGIVSSRYIVESESFRLGGRTLDSLSQSVLTQDLNFQR